MLDKNNRESFKTVGELIRLLSKFPGDAPVFVCGEYGWFHAPADFDYACLDSSNLDEEYDREYYDTMEEEPLPVFSIDNIPKGAFVF